MHTRDALAELVRRDPRLQENAAYVEALSQSTADISFQAFFEPLSAVLVEGNANRLLDVRAEDLASWVSHIAASTFCRMRALEVPVLENLVANRTLAAMALLRSHFEAAAMSAYCLERLTDAARSDEPSVLAALIPKTLFGTGLKKFRDKHAAADLLLMCERDTIRICEAVESLDKFYYQDDARGDLSVVYSLLCDFAHPNHRGVLGFMQAVERPNGWLISYVKDEPPDNQMTVHAIETLLVSMRAGYASSDMLRSWRFSERTRGHIDWRGPSPDDGARTWVRYLQRPLDGHEPKTRN
jgi:hypothetical protein